jgi:hypothetical protein
MKDNPESNWGAHHHPPAVDFACAMYGVGSTGPEQPK